MNELQMTSYRPYLMRALYEWIADNDMTPHILVDAGVAGVRVPKHTIADGKVVLNIAERAVARLQMDNERITFSARFGGAPHQVLVPIDAVLAIYARETGQGMALPADTAPPRPASAPTTTAPAAVSAPAPVAVQNTGDSGTPPSERPPPRRGHLKVVK